MPSSQIFTFEKDTLAEQYLQLIPAQLLNSAVASVIQKSLEESELEQAGLQ
jgi:hypothetical protein